DRAAVDDCKFVVVPGLGRAERVAEDKTADVALLRVFGARDLVPAALADLGGGSDATLIGIADPEKQNGGAAISTVRRACSALTAPRARSIRRRRPALPDRPRSTARPNSSAWSTCVQVRQHKPRW